MENADLLTILLPLKEILLITYTLLNLVNTTFYQCLQWFFDIAL